MKNYALATLPKGASVKLCKAGLLFKIRRRVFASFSTLHQALAKQLQHFNSTYGDAIEYIQILHFFTFFKNVSCQENVYKHVHFREYLNQERLVQPVL